jgi:PiT family inorganic phosphate transporter
VEIIFVVVLVIALALFFDFTNGFHDTANAMATPIATGAIKPKAAVTLAAVLNLVGAFLSTEVAKTISGGIIKEGGGGVQITPDFILAGLIGAIIWNMATWRFGLPSSSSHALFGGLIGAAIVGAGLNSVDFGVFLSKVVIPALAAPIIAGFGAYLCTRWRTRSLAAMRTARPPIVLRSSSVRSSPRPWWRWHTARTTHRRRWV